MRPYLDPALLSAIAPLKLRAQRVVEGTLAGMHASPLHGSSAEFAEYKEYAPGDEIRHVDWRAFARSDRYHVKKFHEESNLRAYLLVDVSGSMRFGSGAYTKLHYASTLAASLAWLLLRQGDAVALAPFADSLEARLAPSSRLDHLDDILAVLERPQPAEQPTDLATVLETAAQWIQRRSVVILLSDLLDTEPRAQQLLGVLRSRHCDVILLHLVDPAELSLPYEGLTLFVGLENDGTVLAEPDDLRRAYQAQLQAHFDAITARCREHAIDYTRLLTDSPYERVLVDLLLGRDGQRRRLARRLH